jgi:hypothetical protein
MSQAVSRFALAAAFVLVACGSDPGAPDGDASGLFDAGDDGTLDGGVFDVPCTVVPPTECPNPAPRFDDVAPIFKKRCATCHISDWTGPWPLDSYSHIADWAAEIRGQLGTCSMPPPEAGTPLPNDESEKIMTWILCKTPK